jgi:RNA polymerase sigma factor (sigma-70 family)
MGGTLGDQRSDATLVAAAVAGDRHAFAGIYDRYSDRMHDFCWSLLRSPDEAADATQDTFVIAADRLHQLLRDPDKLRPWLYAVARSVAMGQLRHRRRERAEADFEEIVDVADGPHEVAHRGELRDLVWEAAQGLSERDRAVMDLHLRQGLEGRDLAVAMDVTENNANVMLSRVRDRVERSLGAFLVARLGSEHCVELQALLRNWDGRFTPLVRKRVARHVDECEACDARRGPSPARGHCWARSRWSRRRPRCGIRCWGGSTSCRRTAPAHASAVSRPRWPPPWPWRRSLEPVASSRAPRRCAAGRRTMRPRPLQRRPLVQKA